jgi:hypothetical protein
MTPQTPAIVRRELEPTHPCIRCGREGVPAEAGLCELCNPLELSQPSATQMHGIAAVGILGFIVLLALLARVAMVGTGPFVGQVTNIATASGGLAVTLSVVNEGSNATATTCRIRDAKSASSTNAEAVQTPRIAAGETLIFTRMVTRFGPQPIPLAVECGRR